MAATLRRLTDAERVNFSATSKDARRCLTLIATGAIQCDRCEGAAQTAAFSAGCTDAICYGCYPAFHADSAKLAREAARAIMARN